MRNLNFENAIWLYNEAKTVVDEYRGAIQCLNWRDEYRNKSKMKRKMLQFKAMELILSDEIEYKWGKIL